MSLAYSDRFRKLAQLTNASEGKIYDYTIDVSGLRDYVYIGTDKSHQQRKSSRR